MVASLSPTKKYNSKKQTIIVTGAITNLHGDTAAGHNLN